MEKLTQSEFRIYIGEWEKKMAGSSIFYKSVFFQFIFCSWDSTWLYACGYVHEERIIAEYMIRSLQEYP